MASDRKRHNSIKYGNPLECEKVKKEVKKFAPTHGREAPRSEPFVPEDKEHLTKKRQKLNKELTKKWTNK